MKKKFQIALLLSIFTMSFSFCGFSQDEEFEDLRILYMDGEYEKLIKKSERYTDKDDTRKSAQPYLFLSKAYYEISMDEKYHEDYRPDRAFRDALKWAKRYRRYDPEGALFEENDLYFRELKESAFRSAAAQMAEEKYSRARRFYDAIADFDPEDPGAWLMLGYCQTQERNVREAELSFAEAGKVMTNRDLTTLNSVEKDIFLQGVLQYSDYLLKESMRDSARTTMQMAVPALEGDPEFDTAYQKLN